MEDAMQGEEKRMTEPSGKYCVNCDKWDIDCMCHNPDWVEKEDLK